MLKGILLGICSSVFVVSLILTISGFSGNLEPNLITGNVIGPSQLTNYSVIALIGSFIAGALAIFLMKNKEF